MKAVLHPDHDCNRSWGAKFLKIVSALGLMATLSASAQGQSAVSTNRGVTTNAPLSAPSPTARTNQPGDYVQLTEKIREDCIKGRRNICGRILKVLPDGLIVDSGYSSLLREPLDRSWLIPGTVQAARDPHLIECQEPDCICVGLVYLSELPKLRRVKPKAYDYVVIEGYPAGHYRYASVGKLERTVRHFSATLESAIKINREVIGSASLNSATTGK